MGRCLSGVCRHLGVGSCASPVDPASARHCAQCPIRGCAGLGQPTQPRRLVRRYGEAAGRSQWRAQAGHMGMGSVQVELEQSHHPGEQAERALRPRHGLRPRQWRDRTGGRVRHRHRLRLGRRVAMGSDFGGVVAAPHRQRTQSAHGAYLRLTRHRLCSGPPRPGGGRKLWLFEPAGRRDLGVQSRHDDVHRSHSAGHAAMASPALKSRRGLLPKHGQDLRVRRHGPQQRVSG